MQQPLQPQQSHTGKKKNGGDSDQCYSSVYVPTNPNHHLIESSFSSSNSTKASGSGLSCGLSGHSSSSQNTCKRDRINLKAPGGGSATCSSCGSEENSLCRPSNTYNTKEQQQQKAWNTNGSLLEPVVIQQEVRNPKLKRKKIYWVSQQVLAKNISKLFWLEQKMIIILCMQKPFKDEMHL